MTSSIAGDEKSSGLWGQLPSFDPSTDDVREFIQKARFLHGVFPSKEKPNLAPRLAMQCKGTAWSQVRQLDPSKLVDAELGVEYLLSALADWEETSELKTFELFEKAMYKVTQKSDEATHSFTLRLQAAFHDLGTKVTVSEMQAFILLRQSCLSNEDKKRVLSMTGGELSLSKVEQAMRTLSTRVLFGSGEVKKKVYPANYVDTGDEHVNQADEIMTQSTYHVSVDEDEALTAETIESLVQAGDEDAMVVQQFERDFENMMQDIPDLQSALVTYQEARARISDRKRSRGFWPSKSRGKSFGRGGKKGGFKGSGKDELLARISRTHCKICGALGHWKAECPQRQNQPKETANVAHAEDEDSPHDLPQVIIEENFEAGVVEHESCLVVQQVSPQKHPSCIRPDTCRKAYQFWTNKLKGYNKVNNGDKTASRSIRLHVPPWDRNGAMPKETKGSTTSEPVECHHSQTAVKAGSMTGLAIIDTGASRSVIGNDLVLPMSIRQQVREQPSKVGFRFGNNQVSYSFKQLQIPLVYGKHRIWLLVEVVPKATPFLLSIKTMKSLGANIDLSQNTCFLKTLQRSLPLKENSNGLFMIDIADLCRNSEHSNEAAFTISSDTIDQPPGLTPVIDSSHAEPPGSPRSSSQLVRRGDGEPQNFVLHALHDDQSGGTRDPDAGVRDAAHQSTGERGAQSESQDPRAGESHHEPVHQGQVSSQWTSNHEPKPDFDNGLRTMGARRNGSGRGRPDVQRPLPWQWSGPKFFPTDITSEEGANTANASSSSCSQSKDEDRRNPTDGINNPSRTRECRPTRVSRDAKFPRPSRIDPGRIGSLGKQNHHLGKEASRKDVRGHIRFRSRLHEVDSFSNLKPGRGHGGLCQLRHDSSSSRRSCTEACERIEQWEPLPASHAYHARDETNHGPMLNEEEARWIMDAQKLMSKGRNQCPQLDVLEVYAYPNSQLTEVAQACGLRAKRFTLEDGDLRTSEGRANLLFMIMLYRPKHVWMSPECGPWSPWNRFNASRSLECFQKIQEEQYHAKVHVKLCNLICKIQVSSGRHAHMENPWTASIWKHPQLAEMLRWTMAARLDQCMVGLRHPNTDDPMQKRTRIQTTSREMFQALDDRICSKQHDHHQIAGSCTWKGHRMQVSKFAGFYPRAFAKAIVKGILATKEGPMEIPIMHTEDIEPPTKRQKTEHDSPMEGLETSNNESWKDVLEQVRQELPKSGIKVWTNPLNPVVQRVQKLLPNLRVGAIKAGKGLERFIVGDAGWVDELPIRKTVAMKRFNHEIQDLGMEDWTQLSKAQQHRKACPSHVMICVFAQNRSRETENRLPHAESGIEPFNLPEAPVTPAGVTPLGVDVPTWTPLAAAVSGPKFLALNEHDQGVIKKLHNNLGHPTAEKLSRHLAEANAQRALIEGASDYLCASCAERKPPALTTPGNLKDASDFNEKVYLDGFDWEGKSGIKVYVLHILDEATRFHLGTRTTRDSDRAIKVVKQTWFQWAGPPQNLAHDQGGEFMTDEWKLMLQENNIRPILSVAPWQRGRIERHGGIIKEMLNRIGNEQVINDLAQFDEALQQCFHAKNTMSIVNGYSPEQAVLGRASKLPASIVEDEDLSAHISCHGSDIASDRFRKRLELRSAARAAFSRADNSDALRRALARQSRGMSQPWACGQLCMYWDRRKSPNMLEKGRWNGPAQVVSQESRTIVWITHMNRLHRCAKENLRPVSLREFQRHSIMNQTSTNEQLQQRHNVYKHNSKKEVDFFNTQT